MKRKQVIMSNLQIFICSTLLAFIPAFRGNTRDTSSYIGAFTSTTSFPNPIDYYIEHRMEWSFGLLSWIVNLFSDSSVVFFYIYSFIIIIIIGLASKKFEINSIEVYLIYIPSFFVIQQLSQIRQGLGSALTYLSLSYLFNINSFHDRNSLGFCIALIASLFTHVTSLILTAYFLLTFLAKNIKTNLKTLLSIRAGGKLTSSHVKLLFLLTFIVCLIFVIYSPPSFVVEYLNLYLNSAVGYQELEEFSRSRSLFSLPNLRIAVILFIAYILYRRIPSLRGNYIYSNLIGIYGFGLIARLLLSFNAVFSGRIGAAFSFAEIFMIPIILNSSVLLKKWKWMFILVYFIIQGYITLWLQVPFMIEDYFT
jgi:hypothetical protein